MCKCIGYRAPVGAPKYRQQPIAQCGKRVSCRASCRMPGIFTKCHIPHVMDRVLDRPISAPQPFTTGCSSFFWTHTDQSIAHLTTVFTALQDNPFAVTPHHLLHIWPVYILDMCGATGQGACLQAPMPLLGGWSNRIPDL